MLMWCTLCALAVPTAAAYVAVPASAPPGSTDPVLYLLSRAGCSELDEFEYDDGGEFPGAQGALECCPDSASELCLRHNLTRGGHYNGAKLAGVFLAALGQARPAAFVFEVAAPRGAWLGWTAIDATGQVFAAKIPDCTNIDGEVPSLRRVRLPLDNATFQTHYGGANDGRLHLPLMGVIIQSSGSRTTNTVGQLRFANLSLEFTSAAEIPGAAVLTLSASTTAPGSIAQQATGHHTLTLSVQNRLQITSVSNPGHSGKIIPRLGAY